MSYLSPGINLHRGFNILFGGAAASTDCVNGPTWTQRAINSSQSWRTAAYGKDSTGTTTRLMAGAAGAGGAPQPLSYSDDFGVTWTSSVTPPQYAGGSTLQYCLAYGGGAWVAGGDFVSLARSADGGATWTQIATTSWGKGCLWYGDSTFFGVGTSDSNVHVSTNGGQLWNTDRNLGGGSTSGSAVWGGTDGVGGHIIIGGGTVQTFRSIDGGVTWASGGNLPAAFATSGALFGAFGNGTWVVSPSDPTNNRVAYSTDRGATWQTATVPVPPGTDAWAALLYSQGRFLLASTVDGTGLGSIAQSSDGITWTTATNQVTWPASAFNPRSGFIADGAGHYAIVPATAAANTVIQTGLC